MGAYRREGDVYRGDPFKPNHYSHDSLGDPYTCDEDHNHPSAAERREELRYRRREERDMSRHSDDWRESVANLLAALVIFALATLAVYGGWLVAGAVL